MQKPVVKSVKIDRTISSGVVSLSKAGISTMTADNHAPTLKQFLSFLRPQDTQQFAMEKSTLSDDNISKFTNLLRLKYRHSPLVKKRVFAAFFFQCQECGLSLSEESFPKTNKVFNSWITIPAERLFIPTLKTYV